MLKPGSRFPQLLCCIFSISALTKQLHTPKFGLRSIISSSELVMRCCVMPPEPMSDNTFSSMSFISLPVTPAITSVLVHGLFYLCKLQIPAPLWGESWISMGMEFGELTLTWTLQIKTWKFLNNSIKFHFQGHKRLLGWGWILLLFWGSFERTFGFFWVSFGFGGFSLCGVLEGLGFSFSGGGKLVGQWRKLMQELRKGVISVLMLLHTEVGVGI